MGEMKIKKTYRSETAHIVRGAFSERCRYNIHGHSYKWELEVSVVTSSEDEGQNPLGLNSAGMIIDFGDLKAIKNWIDLFDHALVLWKDEKAAVRTFMEAQFARVIVMNRNPTAENMARALVHYAEEYFRNKGYLNFKVAAGVWETQTGYAYSDSGDVNDRMSYLSDELMDQLNQIMENDWDSPSEVDLRAVSETPDEWVNKEDTSSEGS